MKNHILMITDRSGSMQMLAEDVRGGHNAFLEDLASHEHASTYAITLWLFNHQRQLVEQEVPVTLAVRLDADTYRPGGSTALLDAIGNAITSFRENVTLEPDDRVLVIIQTDGLENASSEWTRKAVAAQRAELEGLGWTFAFHGAGPEGWHEQQAFGVGTRAANTSVGTHAVYGSYANSTRSWSANNAAGDQSMRSVDFAELTQKDIDAQTGEADGTA